MTKRVDFTQVGSTVLLEYKLLTNLPAKANAEFVIRAKTRATPTEPPVLLEARVVADVVASMFLQSVSIVRVPEGLMGAGSDTFEYVEDNVKTIYVREDVLTEIPIILGLTVLDELGTSIDISSDFNVGIQLFGQQIGQGLIRNGTADISFNINPSLVSEEFAKVEKVYYSNNLARTSVGVSVNAVNSVCVAIKPSYFSLVSVNPFPGNQKFEDIYAQQIISPDPIAVLRLEAWQGLTSRNDGFKVHQPTPSSSIPTTIPTYFGPIGTAIQWVGTAAADTAVYVGEGTIVYGALDTLKRPTGVKAFITKRIIKPTNKPGPGTSASSSIKPPGFPSDNPPGPTRRARGHLLARLLGGSGKIPENLVTMYQNPTNTPCMYEVEDYARQAVERIDWAIYSAEPIYNGGSLEPSGIKIAIVIYDEIRSKRGPEIVFAYVSVIVNNTTDRRNCFSSAK